MGKKELKKDSLAHLLAGGGAGALSAIATCPLDVARTVLQVQRMMTKGPLAYKGTFGTLGHLLKHEGIRGWYKGLGTTMMALIPTWSIYFLVYNSSKDFAITRMGVQEGPVLHMTSAVGAAIITDVAVNPLWVVKTRLQTQHLVKGEPKYRHTFDALKKMTVQEGPRSLFRGLVPQLFGAIHVAIQFPLYEALKNTFASSGNKEVWELSPLELIVSSSASKVCASIAAYPHEVLRAQLQVSQDGWRLRSVIKRIWRNEGWRGFYRGMGTSLFRVVPSCALTFTTYEMLLRKLQTNKS